jgi:hypothetical protein
MALYRSLAPEHRPDAAIAIGLLSANDRLDGVHKLIVWLRRTSNPFKGLGDGSLEASGEVRSSRAVEVDPPELIVSALEIDIVRGDDGRRLGLVAGTFQSLSSVPWK